MLDGTGRKISMKINRLDSSEHPPKMTWLQGKAVVTMDVYSCELNLTRSLVIAGLSDLKRPADKLSVPQSAALSATGLVWSRYSMVIIPKNWSLFSVNVFVAATGLYSFGRAVKRNQVEEEVIAIGGSPTEPSGRGGDSEWRKCDGTNK
uniref:Mitochondrial pyruvate carrier n=1 Tax=Timema monikensis TaxID=170555 RepID=A0A7R9HRA7_9NEOP|nr:unnamed protein product [Timema monikensis]